ncbi:MAG: anti-sigma factor antagonist [Chloroflexi bacterium]|nr:MAG: anti-sigma factor antagonist [Chloroflexota bacterium]
MSSTDLIIHDISDVVVVKLIDASILNAQAIETIGRRLYELVDAKASRKIVLDFSDVKVISSSLLSVLITLQKKAQAINGRVAIAGLRKDLRKPFKITQLDKMFSFYDDQEAALADFGVRLNK